MQCSSNDTCAANARLMHCHTLPQRCQQDKLCQLLALCGVFRHEAWFWCKQPACSHTCPAVKLSGPMCRHPGITGEHTPSRVYRTMPAGQQVRQVSMLLQLGDKPVGRQKACLIRGEKSQGQGCVPHEHACRCRAQQAEVQMARTPQPACQLLTRPPCVSQAI